MERRYCHRRCGIPADRLEHDRNRLHPDLPHLFGDHEAVSVVGNNEWCFDAVYARETCDRVLEHSTDADKRQELFRVKLARKRPEPRARTAGKNDRRYQYELLILMDITART